MILVEAVERKVEVATFSFLGIELLREEKKLKSLNIIVDRGVESLDEKDINPKKAR